MRYDAAMRCLPLLLILSSGAALADRKYEIKDNELVVPHAVLYETGKAALLLAQSADAIAYVKGYLGDKTLISTLRIEVHTDSLGASARNQALSEQRALEVARALVANGVDCKRLVPVGFGETKPISDNSTAEGKAKNRRTSFHNAALRGRLIGGAPADGGGKIAGDPCS